MIATLLLRAAALLVPRDVRGEWLEEWNSELFYVPRRRALFCLGAWKDAWWVRRHSVRIRAPLLASPATCLAILAVVAAGASIGLKALPPMPQPGSPFATLALRPIRGKQLGQVSRAEFEQLRRLASDRFPKLAFASKDGETGYAQTVLGVWDRNAGTWYVPVAANGERGGYFYETPRQTEPIWPEFALVCFGMFFAVRASGGLSGVAKSRRHAAFLAAKLGLLAPLMFLLAAFAGFAALAPYLAMWAVLDQRRRCPQCLRKLALPARFGFFSRVLTDWRRTELLCPNGHGSLDVADHPTSWSDVEPWKPLDADTCVVGRT